MDESRATNVVVYLINQFKHMSWVEETFINWMYKNPHPEFVRYLVKGLRAMTERTYETPGPDPDWQPVIVHTYFVPDEEERDFAAKLLRDIPWIDQIYLQNLINDPANNDIKEELERIVKYT